MPAKYPFLLILRIRAYLWKITPFFRESVYERGIHFDWGGGGRANMHLILEV